MNWRSALRYVLRICGVMIVPSRPAEEPVFVFFNPLRYKVEVKKREPGDWFADYFLKERREDSKTVLQLPKEGHEWGFSHHMPEACEKDVGRWSFHLFFRKQDWRSRILLVKQPTHAVFGF